MKAEMKRLALLIILAGVLAFMLARLPASVGRESSGSLASSNITDSQIATTPAGNSSATITITMYTGADEDNTYEGARSCLE
jgi:hypothetical protein